MYCFSVWSGGTLPALPIVNRHQKIGKAYNGIQRRTYLMTDVCQESRLQPIGLFRLVPCGPKLRFRLFLNCYIIVHLYQFQPWIG